jgi:4'-phosphopantetheinyl transferase
MIAARIVNNELHVWVVRVVLHDVVPLERLLSPDERERAARFVFERDRRQFVVSRGALRVALGAYLERDPAGIAFSYGGRGKPSIADEHSVEFNVSHSGDVAVLALARGGPVGVDVEDMDRSVEVGALAERFFSREEAAHLRDLPEPHRREAFFRCWTCKEAYIKALGDGMAVALDSFSVNVGSGGAAITRIDGADPAGWRLSMFHPGGRYTGAVASAWEPSSVVVRNFSASDAPWSSYVGPL